MTGISRSVHVVTHWTGTMTEIVSTHCEATHTGSAVSQVETGWTPITASDAGAGGAIGKVGSYTRGIALIVGWSQVSPTYT